MPTKTFYQKEISPDEILDLKITFKEKVGNKLSILKLSHEVYCEDYSPFLSNLLDIE